MGKSDPLQVEFGQTRERGLDVDPPPRGPSATVKLVLLLALVTGGTMLGAYAFLLFQLGRSH